MIKLRIDDIDEDVDKSTIIMTTNLEIRKTSIGQATVTVADDADSDGSDGRLSSMPSTTTSRGADSVVEKDPDDV